MSATTFDPVTGIQLTDDLLRIDGAKDGLEALRRAVETHNSIPFTDSAVETFRRMDAVTAEIMAIAGPIPPRAAGLLGILVELAIDSINNGYRVEEQMGQREHQYKATMTAHQVETSRAKFATEVGGATE